MSYYDDHILCPKCGRESSNPEICDTCGALISRIRERQLSSSEPETAGFEEDQRPSPLPEIGSTSEGMSLTAISLVVVMFTLIGAFLYVKSREGDGNTTEEVATVSYSSSAEAEPKAELPEATPIYNFAKAAPVETARPQAAEPGKQPEETSVLGAITDAIKARAEQAATATPGTQPSETAAEENPQATPVASPIASAQSQQPLPAAPAQSNSQAPITIGEGEITSSNFAIKASEAAAAKSASSTPAPTSASAPAASPSGQKKRPVVAVDSNSFSREVLFHSGEPVLVDFYATWCGPCKRLAPQLEVFAAMNDGLKVVKLDIDQSKALAMKYKIRSVPTLVLFKNGKEIGRNSGVPSIAQLQASVKPHL